MWKRLQPLVLGLLFLAGGLGLLLQRDVYAAHPGQGLVLRLDIWAWVLVVVGVPTFLFGLYFAIFGGSRGSPPPKR